MGRRALQGRRGQEFFVPRERGWEWKVGGGAVTQERAGIKGEGKKNEVGGICDGYWHTCLAKEGDDTWGEAEPLKNSFGEN